MKVIISGGGTGGHIFPAISIANAVKAIEPDVQILFVGAQGKMEMEKVPAAGYEIVGLPVAGFHRKINVRNIVRNMLFPFRLLYSLFSADRIIGRFKPDVVVGVGGYASGPVLYRAAKRGIPCLIQEQNSYPGITNRILASRVRTICVAYPNMERFFPKEKIILTGNPVRQNLTAAVDRQAAAHAFGVDPEKKIILVIGGSLGAGAINNGLRLSLGDLTSDAQLIWQTGKYYYEGVRSFMEQNPDSRVKVFDFIKNMDQAYALADIVISRAGAGSISELALLGKPVVLVPSPNVSEDHQTKNAKALETQGGALLVTDAEARTLLSRCCEVLAQKDKLNDLSDKISTFARPHADKDIAREVIALTKKKVEE